MRVCYKKEVLAMMNWADDISGIGKERQKLFIQYALHMMRQSLLTNYMGDVLTKVSDEEAAFLEKFAPFISGNNIREFISTYRCCLLSNRPQCQCPHLIYATLFSNDALHPPGVVQTTLFI